MKKKKEWKPSALQIHYVAVFFTHIKERYNQEKLCKLAKITPRTIYNWKADENYMKWFESQVDSAIKKMGKEILVSMHTAAVENLDPRAAKVFFEATGIISNRPQISIENKDNVFNYNVLSQDEKVLVERKRALDAIKAGEIEMDDSELIRLENKEED